MKSNDQIPEDEMLLAEALAAAKARGLGWHKGADYLNSDGTASLGRNHAPVACCARGALRIARPRTNFYLGAYENVPDGNDRPKTAGWSIGDREDRGESLGWAFRCAMTQDESDPETEKLLRERGAL